MADPDFVPLSDLGRLEHGLDAIFASHGVDRRLPLYLTEYGYETNPPNPYRGVSPARQALYLNEAEYMAWREPRVRAMSPEVGDGGGRVLVWGRLRPAPSGAFERAQIQWRGAGGAYRTVATASTDGPSEVLTAEVSLPGPGTVGIAWAAPRGPVYYSRAVGVTGP